METKKCKFCNNNKNLDEFTIIDRELNNSYNFIRDNICDNCKTKEGIQDLNLLEIRHSGQVVKYKSSGISDLSYNTLFNEQLGCCKICNRHQSDLQRKLCVDHDHNTGLVRGLLCNNCNIGLGFFEDNIIFMKEAINYIKNRKNGKKFKKNQKV